MNIRDALKLKSNPTLPDGGDPRTDQAYEDWSLQFVQDENDRWNDACFSLHFPPEQLFEKYHLDEHLFVTLGPGRMLDEFNYGHNHRKRWLGIYFASHPKKMIETARIFVARRRSRTEEFTNA